MAKLTAKDWGDIETRYKLGHKVRDIAKSFNYDAGNITRKAKQLGWVHGSLQQPIQQTVSAKSNLQQEIQKIQQPNIQLINHEIAIKNKIQNLDNGALDLHEIILKDTMDKTKSGELSSRDSSQIISTLGLSVDKVAARAGIGKEPTTAVQINNENNQERQITINYIGE